MILIVALLFSSRTEAHNGLRFAALNTTLLTMSAPLSAEIRAKMGSASNPTPVLAIPVSRETRGTGTSVIQFVSRAVKMETV